MTTTNIKLPYLEDTKTPARRKESVHTQRMHREISALHKKNLQREYQTDTDG